MSAITGKDLIDMLMRDGWQFSGRTRHGVYLFKSFSGEKHPRRTIVPDKASDLPVGTLGAILSVKQTGLGKDGLKELLKKYH